MNYKIDKHGYYGKFGGAFVPEMLYANIVNLKQQYQIIVKEESFQNEFKTLLHDYVGRPSPLYYAQRLSAHYNTQIFLKREDLNHTGSHKINNAIGQILLAKKMGKTRIIAETGAGQHGVATATVCALMNMECVVYMGEIDIKRQAPNVSRMRLLGAKVVSVTSGSMTLKDATNEAIRDWINNPENTYYLIGSVVGPDPYPQMVGDFQSIISKEIALQLKDKTGKENPDAVIACVGGGSNAAGAFSQFIDQPDVRLIAVEASGKGIETGEHAATLQKGKPGVIHGSKTYLIQSEDGQITEPYSISAGLDYPGIGPLHAHLFESGRAEYIHATDQQALTAAKKLITMEGIIPALETAHALAALDQIRFTSNQYIVLCLSGRGDKDLETYSNTLHHG
jgi:tryptophan synthase beta chain